MTTRTMLPPAAGASYARTAKEGREPLSRVPFFLVPHFCLSPPPLPIHPCTFIPTSSLTAALSSLACLRALLAPFLLRSHVPHHFSTFLFLLFFYFFFGFVLLSFVFLFSEKVRDSYFLLYVFPPNPCVANDGASSGWLFYLFIYFSLSRI